MSALSASSTAGAAASRPIDRKVAREAAQWLMRLGGGLSDAGDRLACEAWRLRDPEHERAWQRAEQFGLRLSSIPGSVGLPTLARDGGVSRRDTLKLLSMLIAAAPLSWLAVQQTPWREWTADERTTVGQRRELTLPDGTRVHLNTDTALDVRFDAEQRLLVLHSGEVLIESAHDPVQPARPLRVRTRQGLLRALGTRFVVRQDNESSRVAVLEGAVEVRPREAAEVRVLQAGERTRFTASRIETVTAVDDSAADWSRGLLRASRMPLGEFVAELSRYRAGWLRCDPAVAGLTVSGLYQLDDTDAVLRVLTELLPVRLRTRGGWWTVIEPANS